ncbi:MAG: hypothetical protein FJX80_05055 [Bacteroidetes bacterium]|nr:hypothetical protein [Bacteroidota bacterium]
MNFKSILFLLSITLVYTLNGQVTIVDYSDKGKNVVPYDTSYFINDVKFTSKEVLNGLIGNHLTMLSPERINTSRVKNNKGIGFFKEDVDDLKFGTFEILKIEEVDYSDCFLLGNDKDTFYYKSQFSSDDYIITEGFDKLKQTLVNQHFYSFDEGKITGVNGLSYDLTWGEKLEIVDFEIGKISYFDFGVVFKLRGTSGELLMSLKLDDEWFKFGGDPDGSISFNVSTPGDVLGKSVKIVNDKLYKIYTSSVFKNDIRSGSLRVGMSKDEISLFLGRPFSTLSVPGYDDVWVYGSGSNSFKVLFKGTKSVKIL